MDNLKKDIKANRKDPVIIMSLVTYRFGNYIYYTVNLPILRQFLMIIYRAMNLVFVRITENAQIPAKCRIGAGLKLPHGANGIIIHPDVIIGDNVTIYHQVTIGINDLSLNATPPTVGNNVFIGSGARIIGNIKVSNDAKIGANCVVLNSIPPNTTAVGVPALLK